MTNDDALEYERMRESCLYFVKVMYGLVPQPLKSEYQTRYDFGLYMPKKVWDTFCASVKPQWFEAYENDRHLTWQQSLVLHGLDKALRNEVSNRISVVSGHGIGKSALLAMIILWFLFAHPNCQVACTSPGAEQMDDVLWKELKKWIGKMPEQYGRLYEWETLHIRMKESPKTWFARAKTSSKENAEALSGVHADWVLMAVDEASAVEEPIFETMEGALTSGNFLVFLISNGTRSIGYFYDTHHKDKERWQNYSFDSEQSPRVDQKFIDGITAKYGSDSTQYTIRVKGGFPDEGVMDDKGYVQLFSEKDLHFVPFDLDWRPRSRVIGALDASGEGQNKSAWAVRDKLRAGIITTEDTSTAGGMATKSITICDKYGIDPIDFVIDAFGQGQNVGMEIALATSNARRQWRVYPVNTGEPCEDEAERTGYLNKRAEAYYKMFQWCKNGGDLMVSPGLKDELLSIRFRRTTNGKIQIMNKVDMRKLGYPSPDKADALSLTFLRRDGPARSSYAVPASKIDFDPFDPVGNGEI